jgi:hypothetical protein
MAGERPHRFPHNNFSSVYRIFTKLGHMIPLWKGRTLFILRSKVKVTITINRISNGDLDFWPNDPKINRVLSLPQGNHVATLVKDPIYRTKVIVLYWIFNKLGHMIPLWKGKNPIYFGVIRSKVKVTVTIKRILTKLSNGIMVMTPK